METCWKCSKSIRRDALAFWAVNNDAERTHPVHRACWEQLREAAANKAKEQKS